MSVTSRPHRPPRRQRRGFILPVTVIILALVSVGLTMMAHRSDDLRRLVNTISAEDEAARQVSDAEAEALYLSSVLYRRTDTLGSIRLDGREYLSRSGAVVSYTDAGALLSLRRASLSEISRLLAAVGVTDSAQIDTLTDVLLDYMDKDDLPRLNGAESGEYAAAGLPPPRNERLLTPSELRRLLGWRDLPQDVWDRLLASVHVGSQRTVNRYTVKAAPLAAISGVEPEVAQQLVRDRVPGNMVGIEYSADSMGSYLAESRYITVPSITLLVRICSPQVQWCQHLALTTSGESAFSPWHIDYSYRLPRNHALPDTQKLTALPDQLPDKAPPPLYSPFDPTTQPP
jgi:type II secretory pathway component PulK